MRMVSGTTLSLFRSLAFLSLIVAALHVAAAAKPTIRFEADAVVAERITSGGTVVLLGLAHIPQAYQLRTMEYAVPLKDDDRDGVVRLPLRGPVAPESMWIVVDLTSGEYTVAEPGSGKIHIKTLSTTKLAHRGNGRSAKFADPHVFVKYWFVRPTVGAWIRTVEDGGRGDTDAGADGNATASLDQFEPLEGSPAAPADYQRDDIVFALDPLTLSLFQLRVKD